MLKILPVFRLAKMPPKNKVNKKTEVKKKEKLIEDKTFGMKNKKGRAEFFSEIFPNFIEVTTFFLKLRYRS